jgi:hypothetical protein
MTLRRFFIIITCYLSHYGKRKLKNTFALAYQHQPRGAGGKGADGTLYTGVLPFHPRISTRTSPRDVTTSSCTTACDCAVNRVQYGMVRDGIAPSSAALHGASRQNAAE